MIKPISVFRFSIVFVLLILPITFGDLIFESNKVRTNELGYQNIRLSTHKNVYPHTVEPTLAIDGNDIFVGYKNAEIHNGGGWAVSYTYSSDSVSWSTPVLMDQFWSTGSGQSDPWMLVFNHTLYYMYLEFPTGVEGESQITLAQTSDKGLNWELSQASHGTGFADKETFTIDEHGVIYLIYDDVHEDLAGAVTSIDIKLSRSFDGGVTFIENVTVNDFISNDYVGPYILSAGNGTLYTIFSYLPGDPDLNDIYFDKSFDYGETWGLDTDLNPGYNASIFTRSGGDRPSKATLPAMTLDENGTIYVVWADISTDIVNENWDVYMRYSEDKGETWSNRIQINKYTDQNSWMPDLDVDSKGNVHFAYYDNNNNESTLTHLKHRVYYPENNSLSDEVRITNAGSRPNYGRLGDYITIRIDDEDNFHVVWTDGRGDLLEIYYATDRFGLVEVTTETPTSTTSSSTLSSNSFTPFSQSSISKPKPPSNTDTSPVLSYFSNFIILIGIITFRIRKRK